MYNSYTIRSKASLFPCDGMFDSLYFNTMRIWIIIKKTMSHRVRPAGKQFEFPPTFHTSIISLSSQYNSASESRSAHKHNIQTANTETLRLRHGILVAFLTSHHNTIIYLLFSILWYFLLLLYFNLYVTYLPEIPTWLILPDLPYTYWS